MIDIFIGALIGFMIYASVGNVYSRYGHQGHSFVSLPVDWWIGTGLIIMSSVA